MADKNTVIILQESAGQSWLRDASSYVLVAAMIGTGVYLESTPLQWVGFFMSAVLAVAIVQGQKRYTIEEARAKLDELEREQSGTH